MRRGVRGIFKMKGVHRVTKASGKVFKYHRRTGIALPVDVPEDHPRFIAAWHAAEQSRSKRVKGRKGSISAGCTSYLASADYKALSDGYRPVIRRHVEAIIAQVEVAPTTPMMCDLQPSDIAADLAPLTPAVAASRLKAWRKLAKHWEPTLGRNVAAGVARKPIPKTDGHTPWSDEDVQAFRQHWPIGSRERLAMELMQWTGARVSDAVRLGPQMIDADGLLTFRQRKTGASAHVPWLVAVPGLDHQRKDLMACVERGRDLVFMTTVHGKARSEKAASQWFSKAATDAGLPHLSAHGLRKYRMNQLAEAGESLLRMQSWVGHLTLKEVEEYTAKANRRRVHFVNRFVNAGHGTTND